MTWLTKLEEAMINEGIFMEIEIRVLEGEIVVRSSNRGNSADVSLWREEVNIRWNNRLSVVVIISSMSSGVLHKLHLKALRKRALILDLSLLNNWPTKDGSAYIITQFTIAVKIKWQTLIL